MPLIPVGEGEVEEDMAGMDMEETAVEEEGVGAEVMVEEEDLRSANHMC